MGRLSCLILVGIGAVVLAGPGSSQVHARSQAPPAKSGKSTTAHKPVTSAAPSAATTHAHKAAVSSPVRHATAHSKPRHAAGPSYQLHPEPARYAEIQKALADRGYFEGNVDGVWGDDSIDALKRFQADQKLEDDGKITALSLTGLGLGPKHDGSTAAAVPAPEEKALEPPAPAVLGTDPLPGTPAVNPPPGPPEPLSPY